MYTKYPLCMIPLRAALMLSFILACIAPSSAMIIPPSRASISGNQQVATLLQFAYGEGGRGRLSIGNFSGIPENYPNRQFFKFVVVEQNDWSTVEATISSSEKSYCELDRVFWGKSTIYWNDLDYSQLQGSLNLSQPIINFEIHKAGVYNMMFLNCGNFRVEFWLYAAFFNVIDDKITQLPYGSIQLPTIYVIFGFGVWPILTLPWAINWYRHRKLKINLHWLYSLHPLLQVVFCLFSAFTFSFISRSGEAPQWLDVFRGFIMFAAAFSYFLFRLYISKGYGITRLKLSSHESRAVFGVATFAAVAESAQQIIGGSSVIGVFVFYFLFYFYLYWNSRMHLRLLRIYIFKLREKLSTGLLVKAYYKKYKLILWACRISICFGFVSFMVQLIDYLALPLGFGYIHQVLFQLIRGLDFLVMGYLFSLKSIEDRILVSSYSLRRREVLERQSVSQQRQAAPSIMLENPPPGSHGPSQTNEISPNPTSRMVLRFRNWMGRN